MSHFARLKKQKTTSILEVKKTEGVKSNMWEEFGFNFN